MRVAVCDDNSSVLRIIRSSISDILEENHVCCDVDVYHDYASLKEALKDSSYTLLFLDIKTPDADGIDFAQKLRDENNDADIIFISSKEERVFDTFRVRPFAFVRKSNFLGDITEVLTRYLNEKRENREENVFSFLCHGTRVNEPLKDILYIEGKGNSQMIHFKDKERMPLEISSRMETLEEKLEPYSFLRVHKGYLVNFFYIKAIDSDNTLKLSDGEIIPVSRRKLSEVKKRFLELCDKNGVLLF